MSLLKPESNFELLMPEVDPGEGPYRQFSKQDASGRDEILKGAQRKEELREFNRRSQVSFFI